ncbi:futalosine hydrolase [Streptomyces iconiensis]|uniref:Futalosine hydrolase n=1 Tax=Streptomyces iconiensis TaxID=1384038 RepID=A0ABT7AAX0_9ACTN|nr:futalosine hydrolase [Streptomyces iconiensis]MDJ1138144.1 futalosine hydrolase [Streptomyces iconiensis]
MLNAFQRVLVVCAVGAERDAVVRGITAGHVEVIAAGVGPAAAAAGTAFALAEGAAQGRPYELVVSAGIGGGFAAHGAGVGDTVLADRLVAADLGATTPDGFASVTELGFGTAEHVPPADLVRAAAGATGALTGAVLTVSTVTGTQERAAELTGRYPGAVAEAMEGFGVAEAAAVPGVPVLEVRTVSNPVGPRDRAAWRIPAALAALSTAFARLTADTGQGAESSSWT